MLEEQGFNVEREDSPRKGGTVCKCEDVRENHSSRMKYRVRTGYADNAGEARYDSPEAVSCGVPLKERAGVVPRLVHLKRPAQNVRFR